MGDPIVSAVLAELRAREPLFHRRELGTGRAAFGGDSFLLTYLLRQGRRVTRRATIWERAPRGWRAVHHQGTEVPTAA